MFDGVLRGRERHLQSDLGGSSRIVHHILTVDRVSGVRGRTLDRVGEAPASNELVNGQHTAIYRQTLTGVTWRSMSSASCRRLRGSFVV
jgi:hypothetical protein